MDKGDHLKPRRPLPTPKSSLDTDTPTVQTTPVAPETFYGNKATANPPPLPSRPKSIGSAHTTYIPPQTPPPAQNARERTPYREPELVGEEPVSDDVPDMVPATEGDTADWWTKHNDWDKGGWKKNDGWPTDTAGGWASSSSPWPKHDQPSWGSQGFGQSSSSFVRIDGRSDWEEAQWWNSSERDKHRRPGAGMLPVVVTDMLHDPEDSLFNVRLANHPPHKWNDDKTTPTPPTEDEGLKAVPHPNAYYCPKHNGWIILQWKSSSLEPPYAKSFIEGDHDPLPDQARRKLSNSCIGEKDNPFGQPNRTHHFHHYEKAIDAQKLNPPYLRSAWQKADILKQKRRNATINADGLEGTAMDMSDEEDLGDDDEGELLDLYICCQCSFYCVVSDIISGVIPTTFIDEFNREKAESPGLSKTPEATVLLAWETVIKVVERRLWAGESRPLPVDGKSFTAKIGWTNTVRRVFQQVRFEPVAGQGGALSLRAPDVHSGSRRSRRDREKLLRAYFEINAWVNDYQKRFVKEAVTERPVRIEAARDMYQRAVGAHPDQIPRGLIPEILVGMESLRYAWDKLGLTATSYSPDILAFAYLAQCRCDPKRTPEYFTALFEIVMAMQSTTPQELQQLVMEERSRNRYTKQDKDDAAKVLGFGNDGPLRVELDADITEEFVIQAWKECRRTAWLDPQNGAEALRKADEAFRIVATEYGSAHMWNLWEDARNKTMNPEKAYSVLEVPPETEDGMLLTVFELRLQEQPSQDEKMREALSIIAEVRNSERIRRFMTTGADPGDIVPPTRHDLPRGLNQLGNTCYLNSLLQYFYTIKDLRDAVAPMAALDEKQEEKSKLSDDDLKRHRVGGRLVTRKEISRSKKFISQLAALFRAMESSDTASVTPTLQLAKLALTTSRDEEEDEADRGGTDSSNDTDATLVDDAPPRVQSVEPATKSPSPSSASILGKRLRENERQGSGMEVDVDKAATASSSLPELLSPSSSGAEASGSRAKALSPVDHDGDVEMADSTTSALRASTKPLPQRRTSESVMMFGKQHDVAECMDNCMFQIETALLKFDADGLGSSQDDKTSIVKRLFYGKIRQRVAIASEDITHDKEDLFSHLPVNVHEDGGDIYDGLSSYFDDIVEFDGKKARMEVSLVDIPPLLQIQLQRVQFNRETLQPYKSQAYVKFGETIYMDRFLDGADRQKKAQSKALQTEIGACLERIRTLTTGKHAPFDTALASTSAFLEKQEGLALPEADIDLIQSLSKEHADTQAQLAALRARRAALKEQLEALWADAQSAPYELTSVFVHRGSSPQWGHYFFYSRHLPENPEAWFKYNDAEVTAVEKAEVLADTTGSTANPYLLVFAKKGSEVVKTVNRVDPVQSKGT